MAASDGNSDGAGGASDADLARRLDRLSRDLESEKRERAADERPPKSDSAGYALAFRMASEFVAGVVVGAALGWGLDRVAGTSPWGLIGFLLLGFCAGVLNVVRVSSRMTSLGAGSDGGAK
ncbi:MAG: AtpZ/AtpI family protein [Propylenella sp.]